MEEELRNFRKEIAAQKKTGRACEKKPCIELKEPGKISNKPCKAQDAAGTTDPAPETGSSNQTASLTAPYDLS
jgi:hypothetical protein